jgi:hypothetical protein
MEFDRWQVSTEKTGMTSTSILGHAGDVVSLRNNTAMVLGSHVPEMATTLRHDPAIPETAMQRNFNCPMTDEQCEKPDCTRHSCVIESQARRSRAIDEEMLQRRILVS